MAPRRPILDDLELRQVRELETGGERVRARHEVPALEGDFLQDLGRRGTRIELAGVLSGPESGEGLTQLRERFHAAEPVPFVSDIATATQVEDVVIEDLAVRELAGKPERFAYAVTLREFTEPPATTTEEAPEIEEPEVPDDEIDRQVGTLVVEVLAEGDPGFDFSRVVVSFQGTGADGADVSRNLSDPTGSISPVPLRGNSWNDNNAPAGELTVQAMTADAPVRTAVAPATVRPGETTQVTLRLSPANAITRAFVIHFRFDSAFVEPCMRPILQQVADYAEANELEKLVIVGHTDKAGPGNYNQSLSERRARAAYAFLTTAAAHEGLESSVTEWKALRRRRSPGELPSLKDSWGVHEYQYMLQDLGFYAGNIDGIHGDLTDEAVEAFRCNAGLPPGNQVDDDAVWTALIRAYLAKEPLAVEIESFLPNCTDGILKWLGCGEEDPLINTDRGHRPSRRVEFLFVDVDELPCQLPEPVTFRLSLEEDEEDGDAAGGEWCLGPGDPDERCCFLVPFLREEGDEAEHEGKLHRPAPPARIEVNGRIVDDGGNAFAGKRFVLIAPDGTIRLSESARGEAQPDRTDSAGRFSYDELVPGVYTLEVRERVTAWSSAETGVSFGGNVVCQRITSAQDVFEVTVTEPARRRLVLPVVAHLVKVLLERPGARPRFNLGHSDENAVRRAFETVNEAWRPAQVRFELVDVVESTYRPANQVVVDATEFAILRRECAYPNVVNVFFVPSVAGAGPPQDEPGLAAPPEDGPGEAACALRRLDEPALSRWLAHELGHVLGLADTAAGADAERLMRADVEVPGAKLTDDEEVTARQSGAVGTECVRLDLEVEGATPFGGSHSPNFVAIRGAGEVLVEARVLPEILARGRVDWQGGEEIEGEPLRRRVSRADFEAETVRATLSFRPSPGAAEVVHQDRVRIFVVDFDLEVRNGQPCPPGSRIFPFPAEESSSVIVFARFPAGVTLPRCLGEDFVRWGDNGRPSTLDPLRLFVDREEGGDVEVRATVADLTRSVVIRVVDVRFLQVISPFDDPLSEIRIEGILTAQQQGLRRADLVARQQSALFSIRADLPGVTANTVTVRLSAAADDGTALPPVPVELQRQAGDRFETPPALAFLLVPVTTRFDAIDVAEPDRLRLIPATAGGTLRGAVQGELCGLAFTTAATRGRVVQLFIQAFTNAGQTAGVTAQDIRPHVERAQEVWAQAGIEVRQRELDDSVPDPSAFLVLDVNDDPDDGRTDEERRLLGIHPDCQADPLSCPEQSPVATDMNVYYLRDIGGSAVGRSYGGGSSVIVVEGPNANVATLAHEVGHKLLRNWACAEEGREHLDPQCDEWPDENIMAVGGSRGNRRAVVVSQADNILQQVPHPFMVIED